MLDSDEARAEVEAFNAAIRDAFKAEGGDSCQNIDRIARLPWSENLPSMKKRKAGREQATAVIMDEEWDRTYSLSDFADVKGKAAAAPAKRGPGRPKKEVQRTEPATIKSLAVLGLDYSDAADVNLLHLIAFTEGDKAWDGGVYSAADRLRDTKQDVFPECWDYLTGDRSERLFYVLKAMIRRDIAPAVIVGTVTHKALGVSAHLNDKDDPVGEAWRQYEKALAAVDADRTAELDGPPIIPKRIRPETAEIYILRQHPGDGLIFFQKEFWEHRDNVYRRVDPDTMLSRALAWLRTCKWRKKDKDGDFTLEDYDPGNEESGALVSMLRKVANLEGEDDVQMPFWRPGKELADFPPSDCLVCENVIINVLTGATTKNTTDFINDTAAPVVYDPAAECPTWDACIEQWFEGHPDDALTLEEWLGYHLINDTSFHKIANIWGPTRSGKGTTVFTLEEMIGGNNISKPTEYDFKDNFILHTLHNKRAAILPDVHSKIPRQATSVLLSLSGEDRLNVNRKGLPTLTGQKQTARVSIISNEPITLSDDTPAFAGRLLPIMYRHSFADGEDRDLKGKLKAELSGILNRWIAALRRLKSNKAFTMSEDAKQAVNDARDSSSPMRSWAAACLKVTGDPDDFASTAALFDSYRDYCINVNGTHPLPRNEFKNKMPGLEPGKVRDKRRDLGGMKHRGFSGVYIIKDEALTRVGVERDADQQDQLGPGRELADCLDGSEG